MRLKTITAKLFLAFHLTLHFFRRLFGINKRGKAAFVKNYQADRIFTLNKQQRQDMPDYSRCLYCKLCDYACPSFQSGQMSLPPSYIVGSFSRSLTDYAYFNIDHSCQDCHSCEDICPQHIPINSVISFMKYGKEQTAGSQNDSPLKEKRIKVA